MVNHLAGVESEISNKDMLKTNNYMVSLAALETHIFFFGAGHEGGWVVQGLQKIGVP